MLPSSEAPNEARGCCPLEHLDKVLFVFRGGGLGSFVLLLALIIRFDEIYTLPRSHKGGTLQTLAKYIDKEVLQAITEKHISLTL